MQPNTPGVESSPAQPLVAGHPHGLGKNRRPARLPRWVLILGTLMLVLSFVSGLVIWIGQSANAEFDGVETAEYFQMRIWVKLHGALNPFLCGLLGYLTHQHMRVGWHLRVNRGSGSTMFMVFGGLVVSGTALYYVGGEGMRATLVWIHRMLGLVLPLVLAFHWFQAWRWAKKVQ